MNSYIPKRLARLFNYLTAPRSEGINEAQREYILNVLLLGASLVAFVAFLNNFFAYHWHIQTADSIHPLATFFIFLLLSSLLILSRRGHYKAATNLVIIIFTLPTIYTVFIWGVDVPQALITFAAIIVMSGILASARFTLFISFIISFILLALSFLQNYGLYYPSSDWRKQPNTLGDTVLLVATLAIIVAVSRLFNQEIEKALKRATSSEKALKKERDLLEIKVEVRTRKLREIQNEKIAQIYRFAEFGRLASGLFHDLAGPINLVSLNLEKLSPRNLGSTKKGLAEARVALYRAVNGIKVLENFVQSARRQLQNRKITRRFSVKKEILETIKVFDHRQKESGVKVVFTPRVNAWLYGNPLRFSQLVTNLLSNAIDAYEGIIKKDQKREINISLEKKARTLRLEITDRGQGIAKENLKKIFDPFFSTKPFKKGTGIGLLICKDVVEKDFKGKILVESRLGQGTTFTVEIPRSD